MNAAVRAFLAAALLLVAAAASAAPDDGYLTGYATAVIERDLGLKVVSIEVRDGVARVVVEAFGDQLEDRIEAALEDIPGIQRARVYEVGSEPPPESPEAPANRWGMDSGRSLDGFEILPRVEIFDPLIADPRQPHFSASYLWYLNDPQLTHVGSANFGETFALAGGDIWGGRWEFGFLGGTFSIFDLGADSYDLVNTDFWAGPTLSGRRGPISGQLRIFHQSSHLGDEFLLNNQVDRVNVSYEGVDLILSGDPWPWLRFYGGGGYLLNTYPDLHPLSAQLGVELTSPVAVLKKSLRPIAAFDYASREENHWREELSLAFGFQLESARLSKLKVQILGQWFKGNSPNGQFFVRRIESVGFGIHFWY